MTRGQRGCYIFCTDLETNLWFKSLMAKEAEAALVASDRYPGLSLRSVIKLGSKAVRKLHSNL